MPAVPPSPSVRNCLQASGVRRGRRCTPSQAKTRYYREALCVTNAMPHATRRVCHRVGSHGKVPYLPHFHTYICVPSEGYKPSVTLVEWLRHSCLLRVGCPLRCGRGWRGCGVSPPACPRVTNPRVMCGVPVGTLTWSGLIRGSQGPSATLVEWLRHSCLAGVERPCGVRGYVRGMGGEAAPQE